MSRAFWTWMSPAIALGAAMALSMVVGDGDLSNPELRDTYLGTPVGGLTNSMLAGSALGARRGCWFRACFAIRLRVHPFLAPRLERVSVVC